MCPLSIVPVPPPPPPIIPSVWIPISSKNCVVCSEGLSPPLSWCHSHLLSVWSCIIL